MGTVSALARPEGLEDMLKEQGIALAVSMRFPDHHPYDAADVEAIRRLADRHRLDALVVTEKDWVKLRHLDGVDGLDLHVASLDVSFDDAQIIAEMLKPRHPAAASA